MRKINKTFLVIAGFLLIVMAAMGAGIGTNILRLGVKTGSDIDFKMGSGLVRWNDGTSKMQFSNDGAIFSDLGETNILDPTEFNQISNPGAEINIAGWTAYADAAGSAPVDGTGGAPTTTLTRITSGQLRGGGSFRITKDAANRQGEGVSFDFTIDSADLGQEMEILFEHKESVNYANNDIRVFIHNNDSPGFQAIQLNTIIDGGNLVTTRFTADAIDTNYRLIFHITSTNATAYTFDFDNVKVRNAHQTVNSIRSTSFGGVNFGTAFVSGLGGNCNVLRQDGDWIASCTHNGAGDKTVIFKSGLFPTIPPNCSCQDNTGGNVHCVISEEPTTSQVKIRTFTAHLNTLIDQGFYMLCIGEKL